MINQVRGCTNCSTKIKVVVIRAAGDDSYNSVIYRLQGVYSVETLIIRHKEDANRSDIVNKVRNAGVIFFAGGDQCQYIRNWKNTKLKAAIESVYNRGGGIGGTSAGAMIQSEYIYNACSTANSLESKDALNDPYRDVTFTYNFFGWKHLHGTIIDTHFDQRQRMGRLMAFIARQIQDGVARSVLGVALSEETSLVVDKNGLGKVMGRGPAYFILGDHPPEVCLARNPLTFSNYKIWKVRRGETFNLKNRPHTGYYLRSVYRGKINSNPYGT
jgi:cyanophycinase